MTHNPDDKRREWAAAAREGLLDEAARLGRDGPTLHRHRQISKTLGEALAFPGVEDIDFDPPRADSETAERQAERQRLIALAAARLGTSAIVTDEEVGAFAGELESRLQLAQRPLGGWYPADVLRALTRP